MRKQHYMITMKARPMANPAEELAQMLTRHLDFIDDLEACGILFGAGPFRDESGPWEGCGMAIVRADSIDAARALAEVEPFHTAGLRTNSVMGRQLNEGAFTVRVRYSARKFEAA